MPKLPIAAAANTAAPVDRFIERTGRSPAHLEWMVITAFSSSENIIAADHSGSNCAISHDPLTFFIVARTVVGLVTGAGLSLLEDSLLTNNNTTAESGCKSETAARSTLAVVETCCCWAAAAKIWAVKCV